MLGGIIDYVTDPTGMGGYRQGLSQQEAAQRKELEAMRGRMDTLGQEFDQTGQRISANYAPLAGLANIGAQQMQGDYSTTTPGFEFNGQVEQYLDPSIAYQQEQAQRGIESSAAAQGQLMSGAAAKAIADRAQQIGQQGWSDAYGRMTADQAFQQQQAQQDYMNRNQQQLQTYGQAQNLTQLGLSGLAGQTQGQQYGTSGSVGVRQDAYGHMVDPTAGLANMKAGQMRGSFTKGLADMAGEAIKAKLGVPPKP